MEATLIRKKVRLSGTFTDKFNNEKFFQGHDKYAPFPVLLSAFVILIKRYTDQDRLLIHLPASVKKDKSAGHAKVSIIEVDLSEDLEFETLMEQLAVKVKSIPDSHFFSFPIYTDQSFPFSFSIQEEYGPGTISPEVKSNPDIDAIALKFFTSDESLSGWMEYKTEAREIFLPENVTAHYMNILEEAARDPFRKISEYSVLDQEELGKILFEWNNTAKEYPRDLCLHQLIEQQVKKTPEAVAVIFKGEKLPYRELNNKANQVAEMLLRQGIKPEDLVGVLLELSFEAVISILGILKSGAAYLPLDPDYPANRLQLLIEDSQPAFLITDSKFNALITFSEDKTLRIDSEWFAKEVDTINPVTEVRPGNLSYVMYTSGSTGTPKGILIQHDSIVNNIMLVKERYELTEKDVVLSMPSLAFDASVSKLFPILTVGGSVVLPSKEEINDIEKTLALVDKYTMPYFSTPPSILRVINSMNPDFSKLRMVSAGGEVLKFSDIDAINKYVPILNIYGPTEATVSSCTYKIPANSLPLDSRIPIGKPNPNCRIYILDKYRNCMPPGCPGTLYIGGAGVARGYLNKPELTAKRFIKSPFVPGDILYNTGDVARWLPDGNIDFLGRNDNQVKIRGFRIQTEEVETILLKHPQISECKIIVKEATYGETCMVACVVVNDNKNMSMREMKEFAEKYLPDYMIPSEVITFDKLPLSYNNKVDVKALLNACKKTENKEAFFTSDNIIVKELVEFWKQILKREIRPQENFFHAGGHSLHGMQLRMFINKRFNIDISMKDIFNNPSIEKLSNHIASLMEVKEQKPSDKYSGFSELAGTEKPTSCKIPIELKELAQSTDTLDKVNGVLIQTWKDRIRKKNTLKKIYHILASKGDYLNLSFNERRLWFLYRFLPDPATYNILKAYNVTGELNVSMLETGLRKLVNRHLNLRKNFLEIEGEPRARINDKSYFKIKIHDLESTSSVTKESIVEKILKEESEKPFDLGKGLPIRASVIKANRTSFILVISAHHIIADAWSFNILMEELSLLYNASFSRKPLSLPSLTKEYKSYPVLQKKRIENERLPILLDYWKSELNGKIDRMKLPYDRVWKDRSATRAGFEEIHISAKLVSQLDKIGRDKQASLFMTFFAAFQTLLYKYTQSENVLTGIPIAEREDPDTKNLIGFFVNTLLLSTSFSGDLEFDAVLNGIRKTILEAYQHKDLPFEMLANELRKETGADVNSLIQVMFAFQNIPDEAAAFSNLKIESIPLKTNYSKFDLTVSVSESKEGYTISAEYKSALFNQDTIKGMLNGFRFLLETIARNPKVRVSEIQVLDDSKKAVIQTVWNDTNTNLPDFSVHELFERLTFTIPDSIALNYNQNKISYQELNIRANKLAHFLLAQEISPEELTGILMDESDQSIVSMIAVLKAGAAYLPLDPSYPKERIVYMLKNSGVKILITNNEYASYISDTSFKIINLDKEERAISEASDVNPGNRIRPDKLAYVMYTSGSTGNPKGVSVEHRNIVRLVKNTNYISLDENSKLLKTGAFSFDASTFEIWGILLNGGELFLYPKENLLDHEFLKERIVKDKITTMWFTSSWFSQLVDTDPDLFKPLQTLLIGGDKLSPKHVLKIKNTFPELKLINGYGPTENTTFSLYYIIEGTEEEDIPIGKPIANTTVYVLDPQLNILPVGVLGEIYVGGKGVARGYINDERATQEKFIPDPFSTGGGRLYRTGDLGRWREDGNIEFGGRKDNQIKLRGYRIELGEIESVLAGHPEIEECIVLLKEDQGNKQLIGFYKSIIELSDSEIKAFLRKTLPDFMIPVFFIRMENFPLTSNGKANRQALLHKAASYIQENQKFEVARNATEEKLVAIWEEVLSRDAISITDNFFELGGHSLLAAKVIAKIERMFGKNYPLSILFEAPTIKELAILIKGESEGLKKSGIVPIQPKGNLVPIFLLPGYLFYYNLSKYLGEDQPLYGFEPLPLDSTEEIASVYIKQMRLIQPDGPYYLGGFCASGIIAYEMAQQLLADGQSIGMLALFEVYTPEATMAKASKKYLHEKAIYWKATFTSTSFKGKLKLMYSESKKLFKYFFQNSFRSVLNTYTIKPYPDKIKLFKAMDGMIGAVKDPYMGWSKFCEKENIELVEIPGDHNSIFKEPNVGIVAMHLKQYVENEKYHVSEI